MRDTLCEEAARLRRRLRELDLIDDRALHDFDECRAQIRALEAFEAERTAEFLAEQLIPRAQREAGAGW